MKKSLLLLLLMAATVSVAQTRGFHMSRLASADTISPRVQAYIDSLEACRLHIDTLPPHLLPLGGRTGGGRERTTYSRLFLPMTFYHNIAPHQFSIMPPGGTMEDAETDLALLRVYLHRPDLVTGTQSQLDIIGPALTSPTATISTKPDIVEKVSPTAIEPTAGNVDVVVKRPNFWNFSGDAGLQAFQNYISGNWYQGGESNYSFLSWINLHANYNNKQKVTWDNTLELKLGMLSSRSDTLHTLKTNTDLLRLTSKLGLQATRRWYYTLKVEAQTQLMRTYRSNDPKVYSDFTSPLKVNVSLGMDYKVNWLKGRLTGDIHLAPLSYDFKYVGREALLAANGIPANRHTNDDFGSLFTANLNWKITNVVNWKTRMKAYTSFHRVEYEWENTFTLRVNKYINSTVFVYPRFDDNRRRDDHHGYWMYKEYISLGLGYSF